MGQIVIHDDFVSLLEQLRGYCAADVPGTAGDEHTFSHCVALQCPLEALGNLRAQSNRPSTLRCRSDVDVRLDPGRRLVSGRDATPELERIGSVDQVDGTAPEAPACHARSKHALLRAGKLNHEIHFGATDLV